ncbi:MAG: hypothetical protein EPN38_10480 [Rhodanobacteraceae bacterium]|nr:MAG: hypothetical protein EPN38_10480 [Rhodanobacteraceae bacterium]
MTDPNPITVHVTVDKSTSPWSLKVDGKRLDHQTSVPQNALPQTILWDLQLTGGDTGSFDSPASSGFSWIDGPSNTDIFKDLTEPSSTQIQISDWNTSASTTGDWSYKLCATVNDTPCETNPPSAGSDPGDPTIKNN